MGCRLWEIIYEEFQSLNRDRGLSNIEILLSSISNKNCFNPSIGIGGFQTGGGLSQTRG